MTKAPFTVVAGTASEEAITWRHHCGAVLRAFFAEDDTDAARDLLQITGWDVKTLRAKLAGDTPLKTYEVRVIDRYCRWKDQAGFVEALYSDHEMVRLPAEEWDFYTGLHDTLRRRAAAIRGAA